MNEKEWFDKGVDLIKLGRYKEAIKACEKATELNPQNSDAWIVKCILICIGDMKKQ
ncbi:MAG: tetratricopeptide repeat protein [Candidatus Jettenia sp.]|uniref:Uncharacterized protein n=1 Tax=Candidatus Jettenia caeni TaxID=247490 RepID=I3IMR3_9BACT|nr:tetratricopeptide repeat protein [Candidatus Jettenia sp. AMX1]MBC6928731.1 tetratricopeptide repeat protein [Candidatus Jettenia sp.]NUN22228.1 tetratricopeptide repeat protein [Candidatus Jettenia caeni]KAA0250703.1 MAG: tetratricopeptide repeat protein [Candidatus Jettenia sp. AMX1]MCE7880043.1 tetratricopeptide repeat protein [Candidatus Jettenia sp. AMX1]MCQ3926824.1 tetratricopeptide repeat protein [Candidatus Jettenia sp.]